MKTPKIICLSSLTLAAIVAVAALIYYVYHQEDPIIPKEIKWGRTVQTKSGSIRGIISLSRDGREFEEFLKIPYAQPPIGQMRFSTPKPVEKWEGIRDGSEYGEICAQLHLFTAQFFGSEDCLHLNVHAPITEDTPGHLLPVFVMVHGGSFVAGSAVDVRPTYFMDEDVVVVTFNYRLGVLGFLTTGDKNIRGNMGLKDQALAFKWVKENIELFGGDPQKITALGISAGAGAVHYLTLSESTRGLLSKAISLGGTALLPWAFARPARAVGMTTSLGKTLNCPTEDSYKLTQCLRSFPAPELLAVYGMNMTELSIFSPSKTGRAIIPTVEAIDDADAFLTEYPYDVVVQGKAHRIPWLSGVVRDEGLLTTFAFYKDNKELNFVEKNWDKCIQNSLSMTDSMSQRKADEISRKIQNFYFPPGSPPLSDDEKITTMTKLYSDGEFLMGTHEVATIQRKFSPVYLYYYNLTGGPTFAALMGAPIGDPPRDYGISHADDSAMLFPAYGLKIDKDLESPNYKFSNDLIRLLISFGMDNTRAELRDQKFTQTPLTGDLMYLLVDEKPAMIPEPFKKRSEFWQSINYSKLFSSSDDHH